MLEWLLLAAAVGLGWLLGYRQLRSGAPESAEPAGYRARYPKAFHYLFEAYDAPTLDSFVRTLEINDETVQLHLALANYFRRKGEIEKSTEVHQTLLAHQGLDPALQGRVIYELGQDYLVAGLYDRAEALFVRLAGQREWKEAATTALLGILEHEKDWSIARERALSLDLKRSRDLQVRVAHYSCEMAERSIRRQEYDDARQRLREALGYDKHCVRAALLTGRLLLLRGQYAEALTELKRVEHQDPAFLIEVIQPVAEACEQLAEAGKLVRIYQRIWSLQPSARLMVAIAAERARVDGADAATEFLLRQLDEHPTLGGVRMLLELLSPRADAETRRWIGIIKGVLDSLLEGSQTYRCVQCGFDGRLLHWQCPSCKHWGVVKPVPWS